MPRRNHNAGAPALDPDELADQAARLAADLNPAIQLTEAVTFDDHD